MNIIETPTSVPPEGERITVVLKAQEGSTLNQIRQFVSLGMPVAIGRGIAVIAGASDEDLQMVLGQERDERQMQAELQQQALGAPAHLAAYAQEMHALLHRINVKVGGLNAVLGHGGEPSELMWDEHNEAMDAIWELLDKIRSAASVDTPHDGKPQDDLEPDLIAIIASLQQRLDLVEAPFNINDHVKLVAEARRYRWLRDVAATTGSGHTPMVKVAGWPGCCRVGEDLDRSIDQAMKVWPINEQDLEESAGPAEIGRSGENAQVQHQDTDPRDLFIARNPVGANPDELEKGRSGFVDHRTHADYLIFLAGYQAAQEVQS